MGKIIMASPKVIAVTFDQSNSMKNKYNEFISKEKANVNETIDFSSQQSTSDILNTPINVTETQENIQSSNLSDSASNNNFSAESNDNIFTPSDIVNTSSLENNLKKSLDGVTLSLAELAELEAGLLEVVEIAKTSITTIFDKYRNRVKTNQVSTNDSFNNDNQEVASPVFDTGANIFDSPVENKKVA